MSTSLEYILQELAKYPEPDTERPKRLITSGNHFTNWVNDRMSFNRQVLVNAIQYSESHYGRPPYEGVIQDIQNEFSSLAPVKSIAFPYDDLAEMKKVIDGLIEHFCADFSAADVIVKYGDKPSKGYLILTIVNIPVIL